VEPLPGLVGLTLGAGGLNVNVGRAVGVGAAEVAGCDGDGLARDGVAAGADGGGAELVVAVALVVGCAPMGNPPDGPGLFGSAPLVAAPDDWLDGPDRAAAAPAGGGCEPVSAMAATIPVAAIAITTPVTAPVIPDSASSRRRGGLIGSGKPLGRNGPARCVTSRR
jgi:hypothetical protein